MPPIKKFGKRIVHRSQNRLKEKKKEKKEKSVWKTLENGRGSEPAQKAKTARARVKRAEVTIRPRVHNERSIRVSQVLGGDFEEKKDKVRVRSHRGSGKPGRGGFRYDQVKSNDARSAALDPRGAREKSGGVENLDKARPTLWGEIRQHQPTNSQSAGSKETKGGEKKKGHMTLSGRKIGHLKELNERAVGRR